MVAALLNLYESPLPSFESGNQVFVIGIVIENVADNGFFFQRGGDVLFDFGFFAVAENQIYFRHFGKLLGRNLSRASGDNNACIGIFPAEFADGLPALAFGFAGNGASVDDNQVVEAGKLFLQNFGLITVDAAAEGNDLYHI